MHIKSIIKTCIVYQNPFLYYALYTGIFRPQTAILKINNGPKIHIRPHSGDHYTTSDVYVLKQYHQAFNNIDREGVIVDIGAHIGCFTLLASKYTNNQIIAYEPEPNNLTILKRNLISNKVNNGIIRAYAVSNRKGYINLNIATINSSGNSLFRGRYQNGKKIKVKTTTLTDDLTKLNVKKISLLKLDCEGAEYLILKSLSKKIWSNINRIILEYHLWPEVDFTKKDLTILLKQQGFKTTTLFRINKYLGILMASR